MSSITSGESVVAKIFEELGTMGLFFRTDGRHLLPCAQGVEDDGTGRLTRLLLALNDHREQAIAFLLGQMPRTPSESACN